MPVVPLDELQGGFAFNLQGWIQARAHKQGSPYITPPAGSLVSVGLAISPNFTSPEWPQLPDVGELPVATAFYPSQYPAPTYTPDAGYYPFSQSGVMFFDNGRVNGLVRVDTAGWAPSDFLSFQGQYRFEPDKPAVGLPVGIISLLFDNLKNHVWDYAFTMISKTEVLLATAAQLPRLAAGTGSMKQISPGLLRGY